MSTKYCRRFIFKYVPCLPDQPLTPCQQQQVDFFSSPPSRSKYLPRCGSSGEYLEIQCSVQSDECWCVTENGTEVPQTRTSGPIRCPKPGTTILGLSLFLSVDVVYANCFCSFFECAHNSCHNVLTHQILSACTEEEM